MASLPGLPQGLTIQQRDALAKARNEFGIHFSFSEPLDVMNKALNIDFPKKCLRDSKVTVLVKISKNGYMDLWYQTLEDCNKYLYIRRDPQDDKLYVGTKWLQYNNNHRYHLKTKVTGIDHDKFHVIQIEWKKDNNLEVYLNGSAILGERVPGTIIKDCARLAHGQEFVGDASNKMRGFLVYDVHHASADRTVLMDKNLSYTLPPQFLVATGGVIRFTGTCIMREKPTANIIVYYDNAVAAKLGGLQRNKEMTVELKFHADKIVVSLEGAPNKLTPKNVTLSDNTTVKAIKISRNLQVQNVYIFTGLAKSS
ncbi:uncharacterized protein LOC144135061 [Amblyomma americanum]